MPKSAKTWRKAYTRTMVWKHGRTKPVIGIIGGIGAGKSTIARLFAREGCAVIDSDALSHEVIQSSPVKRQLQEWLGPQVLDVDGGVNRKAVAAQVFADPEKLARLNALVHPLISQRRDNLMAEYLADGAVKAIVWDSPLLLETGLDRDCDAIVYIDVPAEMRVKRVAQSRGWSAAEIGKREKSQFALDKKAEIADYCIDNSGDEVASLRQVQRVLSHLFLEHRS